MLKRIIVGGSLAAVGWATYSSLRRWRTTWGIVAGEAEAPLPGDDLVPLARSSETRGITIDAPPELIWPWLVQMGFGRGGWYSIDQLDMRGSSAAQVVDQWQELAVGDTVPTHPGGGFSVKVLEPNRALVLYADTASMQPRESDAKADVPAGLAASGAFMSTTPREFAASWGFVLEPLGATRTRLIERVRYWGADGNPMSQVALSLLGFGVFVMIQRQMVGIRTRAERLATSLRPEAAAGVAMQPGNGQTAELPDAILATAAPA